MHQAVEKTKQVFKNLWRKGRKEDEAEENEDNKTEPFYFRREYQLSFWGEEAVVRYKNVDTTFCVKPKTFEKYSDGSWKREAKMLIEEFNVNVSDCGTPGIDLRLAFEYIRRNCKTPIIDHLQFFIHKTDPEKIQWQQEQIDKGVPENIDVKYLLIFIRKGFNPRLHERLNYEYLHFFQYYSKKETRFYQTLNDKMLQAELLALSCFIKNPEVLSQFKGWGLLVNYAAENNVDKSFIEEGIHSWIENKSVRRLTGLFDRHLRFDDDCPERIMSTEELEAIVEKLRSASSNFVKEELSIAFYDNVKLVKTRIRFTRTSDGAEGDLLIYLENSDCVGMAFIQPPDEETQYFVTNIYSG